jgi:IS5 family transposase
LDEVWGKIQEGLAASRRVIAYSQRRVLHGEKIAAATKILSVSDPAAALIVKGQRDPVLGYKPQVVRSEQGLITGLLTPSGNAADSACLLPALAYHRQNAGVTAARISCDDGYASRENRAELLKQEGVKQVSFSGSKGQAVIPEADWLSADYQFLRHKRSAVEGCIFILKYLFDFARVRRRGLDPVRAELLEKAIAYNFWRLQFLRQKKRGRQAA